MQTLLVQSDSGLRPASPSEVFFAAGALALTEFNNSRPTLTTPRSALDYLQSMYIGRDAETFSVVFLDNRNRVIACEEVFRGTIDGATIHPREVVKLCIWRSATAVLFAHNHPSGVADPSQADELITRRLRDALALIDVRVLDHFVIGGTGKWSSMAELGML